MWEKKSWTEWRGRDSSLSFRLAFQWWTDGRTSSETAAEMGGRKRNCSSRTIKRDWEREKRRTEREKSEGGRGKMNGQWHLFSSEWNETASTAAAMHDFHFENVAQLSRRPWANLAIIKLKGVELCYLSHQCTVRPPKHAHASNRDKKRRRATDSSLGNLRSIACDTTREGKLFHELWQ